MKSGSSVVSEINSCEFVQFVSKTQSAGRISPPGADFSGGELYPALFRTRRKLDVAAVLQVDAERVGIVLLQVAGGHVEDPDAIAPAEGTVRDIGVSDFVHVVNRATHRVYQGYRAVARRKHRSGVGPNGVTVGVTHRELHRNGAADLPHAAAVGVNWRQDEMSRSPPGASAIADRKLPIHVANRVVTKSRAYRSARYHWIRSGLRQCGCRITGASQRD